MKIQMMDISQLKPYDGNPRLNDESVAKVEESLRKFGIRRPFVVDKDNILIVGHTMLRAALNLGIKKVPVHVATDMTDDQANAYRLADNRTHDFAQWDVDKLSQQIKDIDLDLSAFDFDDLLPDQAETRFREVNLKPPPSFAWCLIGVPIGRYDQLHDLIETASKIEGSIVETVINDKKD